MEIQNSSKQDIDRNKEVKYLKAQAMGQARGNNRRSNTVLEDMKLLFDSKRVDA